MGEDTFGAAPREPRIPSLAEVETIARQDEPIARNLRITQAYHELSDGMAVRVGEAANWCTFATWASKQAGQTIRREDVARKIEADLGGAEEIAAAVARVGAVLRAVGHVVDRSVLVATVRDVLSPVRAAERAGDAVARGNLKVFEEIAREFARFLAALGQGVDAVAHVSAALRPGPAPDGQDLLRAAFVGYGRAIAAVDRRVRAEQTLLVNLRTHAM